MQALLREGGENGRLVLDTIQTVSFSSETAQLVAFFEPQRDAPGKRYVWELRATGDNSAAVRVCQSESGEPALTVAGSDWRELYRDNVIIYERLAPVPRAFIVYAAEHVPQAAARVERLLDPTFPYRHKAIVPHPVALPSVVDKLADRASIAEYATTRVVVVARPTAQGLLILGDQYYPGWRATVDGQPVPIIPVNHIWRGVMLSPGEHVVVFEFKPRSLRWGLLSAALGLGLIVALGLFDRRITDLVERASRRKD